MCVAELAIGKRVKATPPKKWRDLQVRIENIAADYSTLSVLEYLENLAYHDNIS